MPSLLLIGKTVFWSHRVSLKLGTFLPSSLGFAASLRLFFFLFDAPLSPLIYLSTLRLTLFCRRVNEIQHCLHDIKLTDPFQHQLPHNNTQLNKSLLPVGSLTLWLTPPSLSVLPPSWLRGTITFRNGKSQWAEQNKHKVLLRELLLLHPSTLVATLYSSSIVKSISKTVFVVALQRQLKYHLHPYPP